MLPLRLLDQILFTISGSVMCRILSTLFVRLIGVALLILMPMLMTNVLFFKTSLKIAYINIFRGVLSPHSVNDKPWITPFIKHLIHDRWNAYRCRNFPRYKTLSGLIKVKITEAKKIGPLKALNLPICGITCVQSLVLLCLILLQTL